MAKFWIDILKRMPSLAWHSAHHFEAILGVIGFGVLLIVPLITSVEDAEAAPHWFAVHYKWLWIPVLVLFSHLVMKTVYEKYREMESSRDDLIARLERHDGEEVPNIASANEDSLRAEISRLSLEVDKAREDRERIELARKRLNEQASYHRTIRTKAGMYAWVSGSYALLNGTLKPEICNRFSCIYPSGQGTISEVDMEYLVTAAAELRAIEIRLKPEHLLDD